VALTVFRRAQTRSGWLVLGVALGVVAALLAVAGAPRYADLRWPDLRVDPGLLAAAVGLSLLGYVFKAYGWERLFAANERPQTLALAAAMGGASVTALALPGRFDDVVRIAIVRRFRDCPAGVRALCLSLFMLGLVDAAALAPLALITAALPDHSLALRLGLVFLVGVGLAAGALVFVLPRLTTSRRVVRFRLGRWVRPRTASLRDAVEAWALISACWLTRAVGLCVLFGALGLGFSLTLALLFLCASSAAAALPVGPGGTATQAGAGAAALIASGVGVSEAAGAAVASQAIGILVGASIFVFATAWRTGLRLTLPHPPVSPAPATGKPLS
jgi:Lysylphosphatidylglycerol synthase TM region